MAHDPARVAEARAWVVRAACDLRAAEHEFQAVPPLLDDIVFRGELPRADVSGARAVPHGDQVIVGERTDVLRRKRQHGGGSTGGHHELYLEPVGLVYFDHGAEVALAQPMIRQVAVENHGVENSIRHMLPSG
jgi:hypothetical protein